MPDHEPELQSSNAVSSPLEALDHTEHQRRIWELELLISGAVVFALFGVPGRLEDWFLSANTHISRSQYLPLFYAYFYLKLIAYSLIVSFCTNLTLRAYWVGLVGLNKVFPQGVRWKESKEGPISKELSRSYPDLRKLIEGSDKTCSLVFSSSFIIVFLFLFSSLLVGAMTLVAWLTSAWILNDKHFQTIFFSLVMAVFLIPGIASLADKALSKKPPEFWKGKWFYKIIRTVLSAFYWLTMRPLSASMQLTLSTNLKRSISVPLYLGTAFGLIGFFMVSTLVESSEKPPINDYLFFPDVAVQRSVDYRHYEDQQTEGMIYRRPSIQSDVVSDPFVRLFIPYSPRNNPLLAELCPGVEPIPQQALSLKRSDRNIKPPRKIVEAALGCLGKLHQVFLNGALIEPEFDFHVRPDTRERGIVTYLSADGLPEGRNFLRIEQAQSEEDKGNEEPKTEYFIPFWL